MSLDADKLLLKTESDLPLSYTEKDAILYALSVGLARDALDSRELRFAYEGNGWLMTLPTFATVLIPDLFPADLGWDFDKVLHCEQRL